MNIIEELGAAKVVGITGHIRQMVTAQVQCLVCIII